MCVGVCVHTRGWKWSLCDFPVLIFPSFKRPHFLLKALCVCMYSFLNILTISWRRLRTGNNHGQGGGWETYCSLYFMLINEFFCHVHILSAHKIIFKIREGNALSPCSFFFFPLFRATPAAHGGSQARGPIRATAASLYHSHSNVRSKLHLQPTPELKATPDP